MWCPFRNTINCNGFAITSKNISHFFVRFNIGTDSTQNIMEGTLTWFTEVEDANVDGTIVKATWHLGYILNSINPPDFQFKIYLTFLSPTLLL